MTGLTVVKLAVNVVSSLGVSKILQDVIKNNTTVETVVDRILVQSGTLVLGTMVVSKASDHVNSTMDGAIAKIKKNKEEVEAAKEEVKAAVERASAKKENDAPSVEGGTVGPL